MNKNYDIIVIGGGPAGITLAKMLGGKKKIAIIRPEDYSMIYCAMPYAVEGLFPLEKTFKKDSLVTDAGADLIRGTVVKVELQNKKIQLEDESVFNYEKLIIATGATPFIPPINGTNLVGVTGFKTEIEMRNIMGYVEKGVKNAIVVGAGAIGIELALSLNKIGLKVHLVDMAGSLLPNMVDPEMAESILEELIRSGVDLHLNAKVVELHGKEFVQQAILDNGEKIHFDNIENCNISSQESFSGMVVFATGMRPEIALFEGSDLEIERDGIVVNEKMETNLPDVYAVGDCTQFYNGITKKTYSGKLATNAVPMAKVLGFNLLGQDRNYQGFYNGAATKVGKYYIGGTGLSERTAKENGIETICGYSEVTTKFPIMPGAKLVHLKLIAEKGTKRIIGAQIVSEEPVTDKIDLLTLAIQNCFTAEKLAQLSYSAQPYQSFYPAGNLIVMAAEEILK
ncbi:MAG: FAD-dependent oxidoreductase [Candidatus Cloacimonetes bacterium]|nr:FAD-dependent oxidoreductase [Candidatus Cloacimonadota bacterium]